jgi:hypothetical protein
MAVSTKARTRSIAHRWGPVCPSPAIPGASPTSPPSPTEPHWALGVRFDEEDDAASETFVVKLTAGKTEIVDQVPGRASALAATPAGKVFVLDEKGQVIVGGRRHKLSSPRALTWVGDGVALAGADRVWLFSGDGADVREGPAVKAKRLASSAFGLVGALDDGGLALFEHAELSAPDVAAKARGTPLSLGGVGHLTALAMDDDGRVAAASGKAILYGTRATGNLAQIATAPFDVHAVALHAGRVLLSSRAHGLFNVELQEDMTNPKGLVMPLRPSLRAHTLAVRDGVLVVASDLFVATSDGVDFSTRDLAPFVRQAEQRMPKFHSSEDPLTV